MTRHVRELFGNREKGTIAPGQIRSLHAKKTKLPKSSKSLHAPSDKLISEDKHLEVPIRTKKGGGGRLTQAALVDPMYSRRQSNNNGNKVCGSPETRMDVVRSPRMDDIRSPRPAVGITPVLPDASPLNDDFLRSPRRTPGFRRREIQRNLQEEYDDLPSPSRTQGRCHVQLTTDNETHLHPDRAHDSRTSASRQPSNPSQIDAPHGSASQRSKRSKHNVLQSSALQLARGSQRQNTPSDEVVENQNISQRNASRSPSNSPLTNTEEVDTTSQCKKKGERTVRGPTTNLEVAKRGKTKVDVDVFEDKFVGPFHHQLVNSIGTWVRQRDNCPLIYDDFDNMPVEKVARVIQNVKDHFNPKPFDDIAVDSIKQVMRSAYNRHRYMIHLDYKELIKEFGEREVLLHPPKRCSNKRDWEHMCHHFTKNEFKKKSERGRKAAASRSINHSTGNRSHASVKYKLMLKGKPTDPVSLFEKTHKSDKMNDKCKNMKAKMKAMKEAAERGEINESPDEIYYKCREEETERSSKRRRKAPKTHYSLYQQKEEETAQLKARLAKVEQENKQLKKLAGPNETKKWLNEYLVKHNLPAIELSPEEDDGASDEDEDAYEHEDSFEDDQERQINHKDAQYDEESDDDEDEEM